MPQSARVLPIAEPVVHRRSLRRDSGNANDVAISIPSCPFRVVSRMVVPVPKGSQPVGRGSPGLLVSRNEAAEKITAQIARGSEIRDAHITSWETLKTAETERSKWTKYVDELLMRIFDSPSLANEFNPPIGFAIAGGPSDLARDVREFLRDMDRDIATLESIRERLELIPELRSERTKTKEEIRKGAVNGRAVFVVHGQDTGAKQEVARFLERLELRAIVLHEQPDAGRTLIEKFEAYSDVGSAVVLLTPDDVGSPQNRQSEARPRARQNVIFELGFFRRQVRKRPGHCPLQGRRRDSIGLRGRTVHSLRRTRRMAATAREGDQEFRNRHQPRQSDLTRPSKARIRFVFQPRLQVRVDGR